MEVEHEFYLSYASHPIDHGTFRKSQLGLGQYRVVETRVITDVRGVVTLQHLVSFATNSPRAEGVQVSDNVRDKIVEVLCSQALADHLGDVRDAELTLWRLIGIDSPVREEETAWRNCKRTLEESNVPLPAYLLGDDD